jgi:predicted nucleotidyltransferase
VTEPSRFRPEELLRRLNQAGVEYIVIGGLASQGHGSSSVTTDLDVCISRGRENLGRVAEVLSEIAAVRRGLPADAPAMPPLDERTLRATALLTLDTAFGRFDVLANPDPAFDYETLSGNAIDAEIAGVHVRLAGLDDLIAMKRAAGRPKDRVELEILGALREEIDRSGG